MLSRVLPDAFILWLLGAVAFAIVVPVAGPSALVVDSATLAAIFALFFLHGIRLPREALISGVTDWRLHLVILSLTFAAFPLLGLTASAAFPELLEPELWTGLLYLCALPSTVQSSIAYTSIARGNVSGAVAAAAFSNLLGVFLTPMLVAAMLQAQGVQITFAAVSRIFLLLFLPFLVGHALRPWLFPLVRNRPRLTTTVDKGTILLAVYGAFSAATIEGIWTRIPATDLAMLVAVLLALLLIILLIAWFAGRAFPYPSRAAILFCGSVKSLASGVPMARILFPGAAAGIVILPVMIFHTIQLIISAWIAGALARSDPSPVPRKGRAPD